MSFSHVFLCVFCFLFLHLLLSHSQRPAVETLTVGQNGFDFAKKGGVFVYLLNFCETRHTRSNARRCTRHATAADCRQNGRQFQRQKDCTLLHLLQIKEPFESSTFIITHPDYPLSFPTDIRRQQTTRGINHIRRDFCVLLLRTTSPSYAAQYKMTHLVDGPPAHWTYSACSLHGQVTFVG